KQELVPFGALVTDTLYAADVTVKLLVPEENAEALSARLFDQSAGSVTFAEEGESFRPVRVR
ncbi:MAG: DUF1949 domain-containing protein, partial [Oscillospiraceae bacterium]|nr:DUF1949 domain-containing protein [Oscillospiraceae bacterium]